MRGWRWGKQPHQTASNTEDVGWFYQVVEPNQSNPYGGVQGLYLDHTRDMGQLPIEPCSAEADRY